MEVTDAELADLPDDPTDRLHVLSHAWAAATATPVVTRADGMPGLTVAVAEPGPLVAMKLQSVMNRGAAKEATDLLDIVRLAWIRPPARLCVRSSRQPTPNCRRTPHVTPDVGSKITRKGQSG